MAGSPLARPTRAGGESGRVRQLRASASGPSEETRKLLTSSAGNWGQPQGPRGEQGTVPGWAAGVAEAAPTAPVSPAEADPSDPSRRPQGNGQPLPRRLGQPGGEGGSTLEGPAAPFSRTRRDPRPRAGLRWGVAAGRARRHPWGPGRARLCCHLLARERVPPSSALSALSGEGGTSTPSGCGCCRRGRGGGSAGPGAAATCRQRDANPPSPPLPTTSRGASRKGLRALPGASWRERKWRCPGPCVGRTVPVAAEPAPVGERGTGSARRCCVPAAAPRPARPPAGFPGPRRGASGRGLGVRGPRDRPGTRPRCWAWGGWGGGCGGCVCICRCTCVYIYLYAWRYMCVRAYI